MIKTAAGKYYRRVGWAAVGLAAAAALLFGCPFRLVTGIPCPGCGMTHAFLAAFRLDFAEAFRWHPLFPLVMLMIAGYGARLVWYFVRRRGELRRIRPADIAVMTKGLMGNTAIRITIGFYAVTFVGLYLIRMWYLYRPF
jgi:hypothetical protein